MKKTFERVVAALCAAFWLLFLAACVARWADDREAQRRAEKTAQDYAKSVREMNDMIRQLNQTKGAR